MDKNFSNSTLIKLLILQCIFIMSAAQTFDFFYFVQQWPGSHCDTKKGCCFPTTGKPPSDFIVRGLWPTSNDGSFPSNCDPDSPYDESESLVSALEENWPSLACPSGSSTTLWTQEWDKYGTCSEDVLNQYSYFQTALDLKSKVNLLQILQSGGINPDGESYSLSIIESTLRSALGITPGIECNRDVYLNSQLYQIYVCVDASGSNLIQCPVLSRSKCDSTVQFPSF